MTYSTLRQQSSIATSSEPLQDAVASGSKGDDKDEASDDAKVITSSAYIFEQD